MSFFPEHLFGSQCPRSQHAALKEGGDAGCSPSSLSFRGPLVLGALLYFLPLEEKLSFLCRTILTYLCTVKCWGRRSRCYKIYYVVQVSSLLVRRQGSSRLESADNPGKAKLSNTDCIHAGIPPPTCAAPPQPLALRNKQPVHFASSLHGGDIFFQSSRWRQRPRGWRPETASARWAIQAHHSCNDTYNKPAAPRISSPILRSTSRSPT